MNYNFKIVGLTINWFVISVKYTFLYDKINNQGDQKLAHIKFRFIYYLQFIL